MTIFIVRKKDILIHWLLWECDSCRRDFWLPLKKLASWIGQLRIYFACHNHHPVFSSFMIYHRVRYRNNTAVSHAYSSVEPELTPSSSCVRVSLSFVFCVVFFRSLFIFLSFFFRSVYFLYFYDLRYRVTLLVFANLSQRASTHMNQFSKNIIPFSYMHIPFHFTFKIQYYSIHTPW